MKMKDATTTTISAPAGDCAASIVLGDLNYAATVGDPVEILASDDAHRPRLAQSARFVVSTTPAHAHASPRTARTGGDAEAPAAGRGLVLCWVDPGGELCHHYTHCDGHVDHDEMTYTGDAFVAYVVSTADAPKPRNSSDLANNPELYTVLFSYRLRRSLPGEGADRRAHCVQYSVVAPLAGGEGNGGTGRSTRGTCSATPIHVGDDEYRITIEPPAADDGVGGATTRLRRLPPPSEPWEVGYTFLCPPLPSSSGWNASTHTFYVWGDVDFDDYGASHKRGVPAHCRGVHGCVMNQIVPQVMIGNCLSSNDGTYRPSWSCFDRWVIQAQYYWLTGRGGNGDDGDGDKDRAMCGPHLEVEPGEVIRTRIRYDPKGGTVTASISVVEKGGHNTEKVGHEEDVEKGPSPKRRKSEIVIPRPFPHDPKMFRNWTDFFQRCRDAERGVEGGDEEEGESPRLDPPPSLFQRFLPCCRGGSKRRGSLRGVDGKHEQIEEGPLYRPLLNVEYKGRVDIETLRSVCPFVVHEATIPGLAAGSTSRWHVGLECPRTGSVDVLEDIDKRNALKVEDTALLGRA